MWSLRFTFMDATWGGSLSIEADTDEEDDVIELDGGFTLNGSWQLNAGWEAGVAQFEMNGALSSGTVRVRMWDGAGTLRLDHTVSMLAGSVVKTSSAGAAGTWTVRLDFTGAVSGGSILVEQP
jgi:hypothetical protein